MLPKFKAPGIAAFALIAMACAMFFPAIFQGRIIAPLDITTTLLEPWAQNAGEVKPHNHNPTDAVTQYLPYRIFAEKSLREDGYIGWNPYEMGGYNMAANTMALPGAWTMQLHRLLPFKDAWNLGLIAEFLIAGSGMFIFLRSRKLPLLPCLIGSVAFMANSQFIIWIYHRWAVGSFCWMPWVLWAASDGFNWKSPSTRQLLLPFFLALALLGGSLQHMVFVALACGCMAAGQITRFRSLHREFPMAASWAFVFFLALGISAFSIIPQLQGYLTNTAIGHTRGGIGYPEGGLQPALNLLAIPAQIWPWLMGDPQTIDSWRILKSGFMNLAYIGTIPMVLGIAGCFFRAMPRQAKWLIAVGLLIPLTPLVGPLYHRIQLLFILGAAWMAAEMLAHISRQPPVRLIKLWSGAVVALGLALAICSFIPADFRAAAETKAVAKSLKASEKSQFGGDSAWIEARTRRWIDRLALDNPKTAWTFGLLVLGTAGLILSSNKSPRRVIFGNTAILSATALELITLSQSWVTFSNPDDLTPKHPAIETIRQSAGNQRVYQGFGYQSIGDAFAPPNLLSAYRIPVIDAYESIQYRSTSVVLRDSDPEERLTFAGVGLSVQPSGSEPYPGTTNWPVVTETHGVSIRKNSLALAPILSGEGSLPVDIAGVRQALNAADSLPATRSTMNSWTFDWPQQADWIRISQNWHQGWHYRIGDGLWVPVSQGPDAACWINRPDALFVEQIEVRFSPRPDWLAYFSAATVILSFCLILCILILRLPRSEQQGSL